jgi:hypothetical protein
MNMTAFWVRRPVYETTRRHIPQGCHLYNWKCVRPTDLCLSRSNCETFDILGTGPVTRRVGAKHCSYLNRTTLQRKAYQCHEHDLNKRGQCKKRERPTRPLQTELVTTSNLTTKTSQINSSTQEHGLVQNGNLHEHNVTY